MVVGEAWGRTACRARLLGLDVLEVAHKDALLARATRAGRRHREEAVGVEECGNARAARARPGPAHLWPGARDWDPHPGKVSSCLRLLRRRVRVPRPACAAPCGLLALRAPGTKAGAAGTRFARC